MPRLLFSRPFSYFFLTFPLFSEEPPLSDPESEVLESDETLFEEDVKKELTESLSPEVATGP